METKEGKWEGRDDWQNLARKVARRLKKLPYRSLFLLSPSCSPWPAPLPNWETKGDKSKFDHRKQDRLVQTIGPRRLNRLEEIQAELPFLFLVTLRSLLAGWSENCFQKDSYTNDKQIQEWRSLSRVRKHYKYIIYQVGTFREILFAFLFTNTSLNWRHSSWIDWFWAYVHVWFFSTLY